ncbi:MAG: alpha/beta hydrolase [Alphaproteobacteria bacterium]|nr:alpha/beta hydrolase [Alphaproteobacteria bacterium]
MRKLLLPLALAVAALPTLASAELPADTAAAIVKMGHVNDPNTSKLFVAMHKGVPADIKVSRDLAFGSDPLQKLDFFTSGQGAGKPILLYVHGGGFTRGDKHRPGEFMYDNVMVWAVQNGMVGAQTNYRLAPKDMYPAANDDVAASVKYIREHAREFGGDPNKIVVWGHSAGASLVGIMVSHPEFMKASGGTVAGAIITSGGYEFKGKNPYLGDDPAKLAERSSVEGLKKTNIPLFFSRAEWDMENQMAQGDMINKTLCDAGKCPGFQLMKGHNHMSQVYSIGTSETQLAAPMLAFIQRVTGTKSASR